MRPQIHDALEQARINPVAIVMEADLPRVPAPVRQYLKEIGIVGRSVIRTAHIEQRGMLRRGDKWLRFTAKQDFATGPVAFLWEAKVRLLPLLTISVRDEFFNGHGRLEASLPSFVKVAEASGPEVDQGELLRFLSEIAWFPTAWLSPAISWEEVDTRAVRAILRLSNIAVSAVLHFGEDHKLDTVTARRYMEQGGRFALHDWSGRYSDYQPIAGLQIPLKGQAMWHLEEGTLEYFRCEITRSQYF